MIVCGDSANIIPTLADESVDLIVTDPPYAWHFMSREWDKALPSVDIWSECLRVLKPGAFAFVMSGPRMDCLSEMGKRLAEAGFETGFTPIFWAYASGFPKAANMGKLVDKRLGTVKTPNQDFEDVRAWLRELVKERGLAHKEIDEALGNINSHKASHYLGRSQPLLPSPHDWEILKDLLGVDTSLVRPPKEDKLILFEREIVGYRPANPGVAFTSEGPSELPITTPATPEAQALDGSYAGFSPKPAVEVVIVAMKPLAHGTYIDQALDNRKGVTWLDDGRIPYEGKPPSGSGSRNSWRVMEGRTDRQSHGKNDTPSSGRFPANLLVSDNAVDDGSVTKANIRQPCDSVLFDPGKGWHQHSMKDTTVRGHSDSGSFSRYFSLDSWWQAKLSELPESVQRTFPFLVVPKAGKKEKDGGLDSFGIISIIRVWKENGTTQEAKLATLLVATEPSQRRATAAFGLQGRNATVWNTLLFGKAIMEKYQADIGYTTQMATGSTTTSLILSYLTRLLTSEYTVDVRLETANGGSPVESADECSRLTLTTNEQMASALGVSGVASGMQLQISVGDGRNLHNTVKPLKLMSYLVTLGSRPGDLVLDPFAGTCTTGMAAKMLGRNYLMVEIDEQWCRIGRRRVEAVQERML